MSSFLNERVPRVPPMSRAAIEGLARQFSRHLAPETLEHPCAIDLIRLTERVLPKVGIHFSSASDAELPVQHAATNPAGIGAIDVLMREPIWDQLAMAGRRANFARSTACHEIGHCVLHVPYFRRVRAISAVTGTLNRIERRSIPAYADPEWQAWEFAKAILMPTSTVRLVARQRLNEIAMLFGVSEALAHKRLVTLGLAR